jgi:hypothetical protein
VDLFVWHTYMGWNFSTDVVGKSITTNPRYLSSGRFFKWGRGQTFIVFTIGVTCKGLKGFSFILLKEIDCILWVFYDFSQATVLTLCAVYYQCMH